MAIEKMDAQALRRENIAFCSFLAFVQAAVLCLFLVLGFKHSAELEANRYAYFRDVSIMIFFGFGFLMTFLRRYGYSAIAYTCIISSTVAELSMVLERLFADSAESWEIHIEQLMNGLFCAGAVMISFGALLGKVTPFQLLVMAVIESILFWVNIQVSVVILGAHDVGGGMTIHSFGAYFGLAVAASFSGKSSAHHPDNASSYSSDITSLAGTLLLWILWPSFNAAVAGTEAEQSLAVINTFVSLCAATVATAIFSRLLNDAKFDVVHVQNATLAGGVAMGVAGDMEAVGLYGAILGGFAAGALSCFGYAKISPLLEKLGIQDTCGVHNLHGMPGVLSAVVGIVAAANTAGMDASPQIFALLATLGLGLVGGGIAGFVMRMLGNVVGSQLRHDHFNDMSFWTTPSDYNSVVDEEQGEKTEHIFLYGTMKRGFHNAQRLLDLMARYNGTHAGEGTADLLLFVDMYGCPYAAFNSAYGRGEKSSPKPVKGELVRFESGMPPELLAKLDEFEQVGQNRYQRRCMMVRDASGKSVEAIVYGTEAGRVPGLLQGAFELLSEYSLDFHTSKYVAREKRDITFKQSWGGYVNARSEISPSPATHMEI